MWRAHRVQALTDKDIAVVADFTNTTDELVFDNSLRQGWVSQLEQSSFLQLLPDSRIGQTPAAMKQPRESRLSHQLTREICQRAGGTVSIESCAEGRQTADGKHEVMKAVATAAAGLRQDLGESLGSVQKLDAPPENVTTTSLEALQAYSQGYRAMNFKDDWQTAISRKRSGWIRTSRWRTHAWLPITPTWPMVRSAAAAGSKDASGALEACTAPANYETGNPKYMSFVRLYPAYLRGEACLTAHRPDIAAAEFQKILSHRGIVRNEPIGALAHLGLARAYAMSGDNGKARPAYQDFLELWKDADSSVPILKQAKSEYAKLI